MSIYSPKNLIKLPSTRPKVSALPLNFNASVTLLTLESLLAEEVASFDEQSSLVENTPPPPPATSPDFVTTTTSSVHSVDQTESVSPDTPDNVPVDNGAQNLPNHYSNPLDVDQDYERLLLTRGQDFDLDYTLLVPVLRAHERQQLDLKGCEPGESVVPIDPVNDPENTHKWSDCLIPDNTTNGGQRLSGTEMTHQLNTHRALFVNLVECH